METDRNIRSEKAMHGALVSQRSEHCPLVIGKQKLKREARVQKRGSHEYTSKRSRYLPGTFGRGKAGVKAVNI